MYKYTETCIVTRRSQYYWENILVLFGRAFVKGELLKSVHYFSAAAYNVAAKLVCGEVDFKSWLKYHS